MVFLIKYSNNNPQTQVIKMNTDKQSYQQIRTALHLVEWSTDNEAKEAFETLNDNQLIEFRFLFDARLANLEKLITNLSIKFDEVATLQNPTKHMKTRRFNKYIEAVERFQKFIQFRMKVLNNPA
jgi:hypothetical protein|tara:strand:+ start:193 stop:567 length:375 start_codon:yes stop_codon:yes gene_type:complete